MPVRAFMDLDLHQGAGDGKETQSLNAREGFYGFGSRGHDRIAYNQAVLMPVRAFMDLDFLFDPPTAPLFSLFFWDRVPVLRFLLYIHCSFLGRKSTFLPPCQKLRAPP